MDRLACVETPALPLQMLLQQYPTWSAYPCAVVDRDQPQGVLLWINQLAARRRVEIGMRYSEALSLAPNLHAGEITEHDQKQVRDQISHRLLRFSPHVEASTCFPGIFWLNASGLKRLYPDLTAWAHAINSDLLKQGFESRIVIGFQRFGTYAAVKACQSKLKILETDKQENRMLQKASLNKLDFNPTWRDTLKKLGVHTLGDFSRLPADGIRKRLGDEAYRLHQSTRGCFTNPLQPLREKQIWKHHIIFENPEDNIHRLLFRIKSELAALLQALTKHGEAVVELSIQLQLEKTVLEENIRTASPTRDLKTIAHLTLLRLEGIRLSSGVSEVQLQIESVRVCEKQISLLNDEETYEKKPRDHDAANQALAQVRARFGEDSVVCAQLHDAHLPEARFTWEQLEHIIHPKPQADAALSLVRRIISHPKHTQHRREKSWGPYIISGGWWVRAVDREYWFIQTNENRIHWIYYDQMRRAWFLQGWVE